MRYRFEFWLNVVLVIEACFLVVCMIGWAARVAWSNSNRWQLLCRIISYTIILFIPLEGLQIGRNPIDSYIPYALLVAFTLGLAGFYPMVTGETEHPVVAAVKLRELEQLARQLDPIDPSDIAAIRDDVAKLRSEMEHAMSILEQIKKGGDDHAQL